jgi:type II secretory pathway component PulK
MNIAAKSPRTRSGSVLIIVLWVAFGLVSMALYFAHSMSFELRASDNRVAALESEQAINGAIRYVTNMLANMQQPGTMPDTNTFYSEGVQIGGAMFWLINHDPNGTAANTGLMTFGIADESGKLNLNTATPAMLETLPGMTAQLAASIVDWRDTDSDASENGAEDDVYSRMNPSYKAKNGQFETMDELRLVSGAELNILFGEDSNLNGILDPNENDADTSPPSDNRDGRLDAGVFNYVTVYSKLPNTGTNGSPKVNINSQRGQLMTLLSQKLGQARGQQIALRLPANVNSLLQFYVSSGVSLEEFAQVENEITTADGNTQNGLININTAPEAVLACLPGIGTEKAGSVVAYRQSNPDKLQTVAWLAEAVDRSQAVQAGPFITTHTYQYNVDIAAVGRFGRGYRRVKFIVDTSSGTPEIKFRQDLSDLGWALGQGVRDQLLALAKKR